MCIRDRRWPPGPSISKRGTWLSVDARDVLAARRELAPGKSVLEHAETIYIALLSVGILGSLTLGAWHGLGPFLLDLVRPYRSIVGAPAVFLVGLAVPVSYTHLRAHETV